MIASLRSPVAVKNEKSDASRPSMLAVLRREDDDDRARGIERIVNRAAKSHQWVYRLAEEVASFYEGDQYLFLSAKTGKWVLSPKAPSTTAVKLSANLFRPILDQGVAMLTQERPFFGATAGTSEGLDGAASEAADALIGHMWRELGLATRYEESARKGFQAGTGVVHVEWEASRGKPTLDFRSGEFDPETGMAGEPEAFFRPTGRPEFTVLHESEVVPDPAARGADDGLWMAVRREVPVSQIMDRFPEFEQRASRDAGGAPGRADTTEFVRRTREVERANPRGMSSSAEQHGSRETVVQTFLYVRSCEEHPFGVMAVVAGGQLLYEGENPVYPDDLDALWPSFDWPIFFHRHTPRTGTPWGSSPGPDMVDLQKAFNGLLSKALEHAGKVASAKGYKPAGLKREITDQVGQWLELGRMVDASQLGYMQPPPMPREYVEMMDRFRELMEYQAGVNAASQGVLPSADTSGRALQILQQRDQGRLSTVKQRLDETWARAMRYALDLYRRYATEKRKVLVAGSNMATAIKALDQTDLGTGASVVVFNDQSIPRDPTQRILYLTQLANSGAIDFQDPRQKELFFELLRLRDANAFLNNLSPHQIRARRENRQIMLGEPVRVLEMDDHVQHLATLEELIFSEEFEQRVKQEYEQFGQSPLEQSAMQHYDEHRMYAQAAMGGMQQGVPMPGAPAAPPAIPMPPENSGVPA